LGAALAGVSRTDLLTTSAKSSDAAMYSAFECSRSGCWPCSVGAAN
jgi:hypothetical protein